MKIQNPIHIKLSNSEATNLKRDMLSTQMGSIRIAKTIKNFNNLRQKEFEIKQKLQKNLKEFKSDVKKLEALLPKVSLPKSLKKDGIEEEGIERKIIQEISTPDANLEAQLQEIQNRLNSLQ